MDTKELLKTLTDPVAIAGSENGVGEVIKALLIKEGCENVYQDRLGNIIGEYKCGKDNAPFSDQDQIQEQQGGEQKDEQRHAAQYSTEQVLYIQLSLSFRQG